MLTKTSERGPTHVALQQDHQKLDDLFVDLVNAAEADVDTRLLGEIWTRFTVALRSHFQLEEMFVFPALQATHPDEILMLLAAHDGILARSVELDRKVDLHFVRARDVQELVERVRAHAKDEDARLYRWAEEELTAPARPRLIHRLREPLRTAADGLDGLA